MSDRKHPSSAPGNDLSSRPGHGYFGSLSKQTGGEGVPVELDIAQALDVWRGALIAGVRDDKPDLTARQMAVLLLVYRDQAPATVRGLAQALNLQKPAVTRAVDRLSSIGLVRRKTDEKDRRNVLIQRTVTGSVFLNEFAGLVIRAGRDSGTSSPADIPGTD